MTPDTSETSEVSQAGSRWYLLETAGQVDEAESKKEAAAAKRLEGYMHARLPKFSETSEVLTGYREGANLVRTSKAADMRVKLDTTRLRRRLDSKLDLLMGKVPKELKS